MKSWIIAFAAVTAMVAPVSAADAAAVKTATYGCKTEADASKAIGLQAKRDLAGLESFTRPRIASGACMAFARGVAVSMDEKKPQLTCVRLNGGLDCYWIAAYLVDEFPSQSNPVQTGRGRGRSH